MPEGPSIVILKDMVKPLFKGKSIVSASGNANIELHSFKGKTVTDFKTWGKHLLICTKGATIRVHLLMLGTYAINERKKYKPRLHLQFSNGELNFYTCSVKLIEGNLNDEYDWEADVMNKHWNAKKAKQKLKEHPTVLICDALLDQDIFSGVGNIIKNEILFMAKVHPKSKVGSIPLKQLTSIIKHAQSYSFDFLKWKKKDELQEHWQAYAQNTCPRCNIPIKKEYLGKTKRRSFFCNNCQELYK